MKVYHQTNSGVGATRNFGLTRVGGMYFCFIDADDWIEPDYLEVLHSNIVENDCEISACQFEKNSRFSEGTPNKTAVRIKNGTRECVKSFICPPVSLSGMVWNKLYKTELFREFQFNTKIKVNEDCLYTFEIMSNCEKACITEKKLYHWFNNYDGACHSKPTTLDFSAANVFLNLLEKTEKFNDKQIEIELKKNYVNSVLFVLWNVPFDRNMPELQMVFKRLKNWKPLIWCKLSVSDKIKYILCIQAPGLKRITRKIIKKEK